MRKKLWLKYCIYILLLSGLIFSKEYVIGKMEVVYSSTWGAGVSYILLITMPLIFNLLIGLFIGIEYLTEEIKKIGRWKINMAKFILVGLPSLFFSFTYHYAYINNTFVQSKLLRYATLGTNFIPIFQIIFGYVVITSFYKYYRGDIE